MLLKVKDKTYLSVVLSDYSCYLVSIFIPKTQHCLIVEFEILQVFLYCLSKSKMNSYPAMSCSYFQKA